MPLFPSSLLRKYGPESALIAVLSLSLRHEWARTWVASGAAVLSYTLIVGECRSVRIFSWCPLWLILVLINLAEAAAATSWLFFRAFVVLCWPTIIVSSLCTFDFAADATRRGLRSVLRAVHFTADTVAFFNIPALQIDQDVDGLMVIRGITFSFSTLTLIAHGIEVGIKLSDDLELALQTDKLTVALFRRIDIDDIYCNIKGGTFEQDYGHFLDIEDSSESDAEVMLDAEENSDHIDPIATQDIQASSSEEMTDSSNHTWIATNESRVASPTLVEDDKIRPLSFGKATSKPVRKHLTDRMTGGHAPEDAEPASFMKASTHYSVDDGEAQQRYLQTLDNLTKSSSIALAQGEVEERVRRDKEANGVKRKGTETQFDMEKEEHMRAAICSRLHLRPSVEHPPAQRVRVTTLQKALPPRIRKLLRRMPLLLRMLLFPLAYFHPVHVQSATAGARGRWVKAVLDNELFRSYTDSSSDIRKLRERVFGWLSDANFVLNLQSLVGLAHVPVATQSMIDCRISIDEIIVYRALPKTIELRMAIQLGGADASFLVPTCLLPHHEHILPQAEDRQSQKEELQKKLKRTLSQPKKLQTLRAIHGLDNDETQVRMSTHLHLPTSLDQELLNFISTLVKASKIIEFEKAFSSAISGEVKSFNDFKTLVKTGMREGVKRTAINAAANDQWIAKMVGKVTSHLETLHGDVGYSGDIPVALKPYRAKAEPESKLLP